MAANSALECIIKHTENLDLKPAAGMPAVLKLAI